MHTRSLCWKACCNWLVLHHMPAEGRRQTKHFIYFQCIFSPILHISHRQKKRTLECNALKSWWVVERKRNDFKKKHLKMSSKRARVKAFPPKKKVKLKFLRRNWVRKNLDCDHGNLSKGRVLKNQTSNLLFQFWEIVVQAVPNNKDK